MINQNAIIAARRTLGQRLAAFRQAAGYGQQEFAPLVHYSRSSLANVETGRQKGSRAFWQRCDGLLAGVSWLADSTVVSVLVSGGVGGGSVYDLSPWGPLM